MEEKPKFPVDFSQPEKMIPDVEAEKSSLPPQVIAGLKQGIAEAEAGQTISFEEFKRKHFRSRK